MASHGMAKERAVAEPMERPKPKKEFSHMELREAENGGAVATHHFTSYEHAPEVHAFGEGEGQKLASHIEKHIGINMPGRAKGTVAAPASGEAEEEG